jgi:transposase
MNQLDPRINEAKTGKRKLYFVGAAHFVLGGYLACLWCFVRVYLPTPCGRQRFNVLGALDAITHELVLECNDKYINSQSVCNLLEKISQLQIGIPITVVLDNAKYQRCELVRIFAGKLNIELLYLPSYSPNLNIIERLWKWVKKDCLYCKYYEKFKDFKMAIEKSLSKVDLKENKAEFDSLFNLKFQMFSKSQYITV